MRQRLSLPMCMGKTWLWFSVGSATDVDDFAWKFPVVWMETIGRRPSHVNRSIVPLRCTRVYLLVVAYTCPWPLWAADFMISKLPILSSFALCMKLRGFFSLKRYDGMSSIFIQTRECIAKLDIDSFGIKILEGFVQSWSIFFRKSREKSQS